MLSSVSYPCLIRPQGCSPRRPLPPAAFSQPLIQRHAARLAPPPQASEPRQAVVESLSSMDISGLDSAYCDDFVCNSSPAVEQTIRAFARDVQRCNGVWTRSLLSKNVEYKDSFRSCRGWEAYQRLNFAATKLQNAKAQVTRLRMLDNGTAAVSWRLTGSLGPLPVDVAGESQLSLNLVTGQIEKQVDTWDLSNCSAPAALAWTAARALWSAQQASIDAKQGTERVLQSLSSVDEEDGSQYLNRNPNDPTRFFQQKDNTMSDAYLFAAFVALLWFISQAYGKLFSL